MTGMDTSTKAFNILNGHTNVGESCLLWLADVDIVSDSGRTTAGYPSDITAWGNLTQAARCNTHGSIKCGIDKHWANKITR